MIILDFQVSWPISACASIQAFSQGQQIHANSYVSLVTEMIIILGIRLLVFMLDVVELKKHI